MSSGEVDQIRQSFEISLESFVKTSIPIHYLGMMEMVVDHMGWENHETTQESRGKRIRPLLVLYSTIAAAGEWEKALPAAWAVELIHNFSLIHDDIQDKSPLRHGRPTIWVKRGIAQAINTGDLLFTLAFSALHHLEENHPPKTILEALKILSQTCTRLTGGQYLDLLYEKATNLTLDDYWSMISGKTAALLGACSELGALCAGAGEPVLRNFYDFGYNLGLAFQVWDDWLGIWGDTLLTGKSTRSDLISGKKTLPVLYALELNKQFARRWWKGPIMEEDVGYLSELLIMEGAQEFTRQQAEGFTQAAHASLALAGCGPNTNYLLKFSESLLDRKN